MRILAIMAGGMDGPAESGVIGRVIEARGHHLEWVYRRHDDALPEDIEAYAALIVFGGEVSVHDLSLRPYFDRLSGVIRRFAAAGKPLLGSCLGSQAIAYAFGAEVRPQGFLEYGFTPLQLTDASEDDPLLHGLDQQQQLFEMHSDTFDLPDGATLLMQGDQVVNQAYRLGKNIYGFQCHFEVDPQITAIWNRRELIANPDHDQAVVRQMIDQADNDFVLYQHAQQQFAETVVTRWLALAESPV